ncbi:MAG: GNAT family N-acetyltransferase [Bacteroidota bacterium]
MNFRVAKIDDLKKLNSISLKSKAYWGYPTAWIEKWEDDLRIARDEFKKQNILLVENKNGIIGFCSMTEHDANYEILHLWMLPEYIGKGIGKKLLKKTMEMFVRSEKPITVEADPNAEPFYKRQGFVTYDKVESFPKGRFLPVMKKNIADTA